LNLRNGEFVVNLNGINHWVKIEGSENNTTPLVLIHGGPGGNHYTFERTVGPLLSKRRTIVYYEQRGCGRTGKPQSDEDYTIDLLISDFTKLKRWLGTEKVDLLGYSFGGELALEFSYSIPEEINNIIVSGPSLLDSGIDKLVQIAGFMTVANNKLFNSIMELKKEGMSIDYIYDKVWELADTETVDLLLFENQEIAKYNRRLWEESNLINTGLMMNVLKRNPRKTTLVSRLKEIKHRSLVISGVFDRNTGMPISKTIERELPNSSLVLFDKSAHFPDLEETDKFAKEVHKFLEVYTF
jgi:proline iminopeptidase